MPKTIRNLHNQIRCEIVTTMEQLMHVNAVKAICFMEEHNMQASFVFDGNDLQATHAIIYVADEPVGTVRMRWFRDFAKFERMSIRKDWRRYPRVLESFMTFICNHVARKGYDKVITHAAPNYARLWQRHFDFEVVEGKDPVRVDDHDEPYIEMIKYLKVPEDAINLNSPAQSFFCVEGQWQQMS